MQNKHTIKFLPSESLPGGDLRNPIHPDPTITHPPTRTPTLNGFRGQPQKKNSGVCCEYTPPLYIILIIHIH